MVIEFSSTYTINTYHRQSCEFNLILIKFLTFVAFLEYSAYRHQIMATIWMK